jgi:hypothetical protein
VSPTLSAAKGRAAQASMARSTYQSNGHAIQPSVSVAPSRMGWPNDVVSPSAASAAPTISSGASSGTVSRLAIGAISETW